MRLAFISHKGLFCAAARSFRTVYRKFFIGACLSLLAACSSSELDRYSSDAASVQYPDQSLGHQTAVSHSAVVPLPPFITWSEGRDSNGDPIKISAVLKGDDLARNGAWQPALKEYLSVKTKNLGYEQRLALTQRVCASYLATGQASASLRVLSDFFKKEKYAVEQVDPSSSLLFAYSYGSMGETDQSLAWFSKLSRLQSPNAQTTSDAKSGINYLLGSLSYEAFEALESLWRTDSFVNVALAEERARRARLGGASQYSQDKRKFWENSTGTLQGSGSFPLQAAGLAVDSIGVLLPLSGKFALLGTSVKNGIELALESAASSALKLQIQDSGVDSNQTRSATIELLSSAKLGVILGPLISETAEASSDIARDNNVPIITFSKSSNFRAGPGVYRLGPTVESQVQSLLDECVGRLGMKKLGIAAPTDESGAEFARAFKSILAGYGLSPIYETSYARSDSGALLALGQELETQSELEGLFLPDSLQSASHLYSSLSAKSRQRLKLLGSASWDNPTELANARAALAGVIFVSPFFSNSNKPVVATFLKAYQAKYGRQPDFLAAQGFDAATLALHALQRQAERGGSFVEALASIDRYEGLTGEISIDPSGDLTRRFNIVQLIGESLISPPESSVPTFTLKGNVGSPAQQVSSVVDDLTRPKISGAQVR